MCSKAGIISEHVSNCSSLHLLMGHLLSMFSRVCWIGCCFFVVFFLGQGADCLICLLFRGVGSGGVEMEFYCGFMQSIIAHGNFWQEIDFLLLASPTLLHGFIIRSLHIAQLCSTTTSLKQNS